MKPYLNRSFLISNKIKLVETILFTRDAGFFLLKYHIQRLEKSAKMLHYTFNKSYLLRRLHRLKQKSIPWHKAKVRLTLDYSGQTQFQVTEFQDPKESMVCFSKVKINSKDTFLYYKTTHRPLYKSEFSKLDQKKYIDLIFQNERGEVTEGSRSNIIIKDKDDFYRTPPVSSGLLNGVYRQYLLKVSKHFKESILTKESLLKAKKIYLCNSVFGLKEVLHEEKE